MFLKMPKSHHAKSHLRSVFKAVSWRVLGSIDTFAIAFFVGGHFGAASMIASAEVATKIVWFYLHERVWSWASPEALAAPAH